MNFKNITPYLLHKLPEQLVGNQLTQQQALNDALSCHIFHPRSRNELVQTGWVPPVGGSEALTFVGGNALVISLQIEEAILPANSVKREVAERVSKREADESRKIYKEEKDQIKDDVIQELLPRALSRYKRIDAMIIPSARLLLVGAGSYNTAEKLLKRLREALGSLALAPISTHIYPFNAMTHWLSNPPDGNFPTGYSFGGGCKLADSASGGSRAAFSDVGLDDDLIRHLESGMIVTQIDIQQGDDCRFTLNTGLQILKLKLNTDHPNHQALLQDADGDRLLEAQATIMLISTAALNVISDMIKAFGGLVKRDTESGEPDE